MMLRLASRFWTFWAEDDRHEKRRDPPAATRNILCVHGTFVDFAELSRGETAAQRNGEMAHHSLHTAGRRAS